MQEIRWIGESSRMAQPATAFEWIGLSGTKRVQPNGLTEYLPRNDAIH